MASAFGHATLVIGIKKIFPDRILGYKVLILGMLTAVMPDADVIAYEFPIDRHSIWAHRGITHSMFFSVCWSVLLVLIFHRKDQKYYGLLGVYYFLCAISHGLLDALTTGGAGIGFLIPFSDERYHFYRWIQVSPIGIRRFFSEWGLAVIKSEIKYIGIPTFLLYLVGSVLNRTVYK